MGAWYNYECKSSMGCVLIIHFVRYSTRYIAYNRIGRTMVNVVISLRKLRPLKADPTLTAGYLSEIKLSEIVNDY